MPTSSDSLGSYLRAEREQRRVSLQEISAATKIQVKFLRALEEDAYDQLPPAPLKYTSFFLLYTRFPFVPAEFLSEQDIQRLLQSRPQDQSLLPYRESGLA